MSVAGEAVDASGPLGLYGRLERAAVFAGALVMLGIVAASVIIADRTGNDLGDAGRSQSVRAATIDLLLAVTHAETGQRGFLLTGEDSYLAPYDSAAARVTGLLDDLARRMPASDVTIWRGLIERKMAELARTVRLAKAGHRDEALAIVQSGQGRDDMDAMQAVFDRLAQRQRVVLTADLARSQSGARLLVVVDAAAFLVLAALVLLVGRRARRTFVSLATAQEALRSANAELSTGRARLEVAVRERTADLTEANAEIQRFAYIVSHDLRAPLLNIIGFTAELEVATSTLNRFVGENLAQDVPRAVREASEEDLPEAIRFIQSSTTKMDRLITAILRLSREGRRVLTPERLDMAALLGGVVDSVRHQTEAAGGAITLGVLPPLVSDRIALEQVFSNVIENALKYAQPGRPGRIHISGEQAGGQLRYTVRDNGRGIQQRDMARVFELFRRAGSQDQPGEGIGLAHVRALLRRLGGTIECESTFGAGSAFMVTLPPEPSAAAMQAGPLDALDGDEE